MTNYAAVAATELTVAAAFRMHYARHKAAQRTKDAARCYDEAMGAIKDARKANSLLILRNDERGAP